MKYIIDVVKVLPTSSNFNAWTKAPADVIRTLNSIGAESAYIVVPDKKVKLWNTIVGLLNTISLALRLKKGDIVYLQRYGYYISLFAKICKLKDVRMEYIVHDLTFLRFGYKEDDLEFKLLKQMDVIYVHTENMKDKMRSLGFENEMKVMHLFDYYSEDPMLTAEEIISRKNEIAFAGNLNKSVFLQELYKTDIPNSLQYNLYGLKPEINFESNPQMKYCGAFQPDHTGCVKAGWGLLWDGDSIDSCTGVLGEYLRINSSHKLSLYLTCGMPVIIWRQSSLAKWLTNEDVCICIDSLTEIADVINQVSIEEFLHKLKASQKLGSKLRNGMLLKSKLD